MGRITGSRSGGGHHWQRLCPDGYRLSWSFDVKIAGSRLRWPRTITRDTDFAGAVRFSNKWGITPPPSDERPG